MQQTIIDKFLCGKKWCCLDFESNGLLDSSDKSPAATKIWVMGYWDLSFGKEIKYTTDTNEMMSIIDSYDLVFVHNGFLFDTLLTEKLLGYSFNSKIFDTLSLSYYLYPARLKHGLKEWGVDLGVIKPTVDDWTDQPIEVYINRVVEDVKIQSNLTFKFVKDLLNLYDNDISAALDLWELLNSIFNLYNEQYKNPFYLNMPLLESNIQTLLQMKEEREVELRRVMPPVQNIAERSAPKVMYKKDGEISSLALRWYEFLNELGADSSLTTVKYIKSYSEPNPSSSEQVKEWLFKIGWEPEIFKDAENVRGEIIKVPQIKTKDGDLCPSVIRLSAEHPEVKVLEDLSIINSRLGVLKGFVKNKSEDNTIYGDIAGLTNTLRSKHRRLVNLPKMSAKYGSYIRPCLIPNLSVGEVLIGIDIASLENYTRTNLICEIDPNSIIELLNPDFDTHLDLAVFAGAMTLEESDLYKEIKKKLKNKTETEEEYTLFQRLDDIRSAFKTLNYQSLYGAGVASIAKSTGKTRKEAQYMYDSYWSKNFAVKLRANSAPIKSCLGTRWIYNDIVNIWFELRSDKDKFSSLNQGLGSVIFYNWVKEMRREGVEITLNMHDEVQIRSLTDEVDKTKDTALKSIDVVNKKFKLTVPIKIDISVGDSYGSTH